MAIEKKPWQRLLYEIWDAVVNGGGGGGSSDFSMAELTLDLTPPIGVDIVFERIEEVSFGSDTFEYTCEVIEAIDNVVSIPLYDNTAFFVYVVGYDSNDTPYTLNAAEASFEGDVSYNSDEGAYIISGNGTISGSLKDEN